VGGGGGGDLGFKNFPKKKVFSNIPGKKKKFFLFKLNLFFFQK